VILGLIGGLITAPLATAIGAVGILSLIYFIDVVFNFGLVWRSLNHPPEIGVEGKELMALDNRKLPRYTVLCPLYKEALVLPNFVKSMAALDWPKSKLEVLLLLEQDDEETIAAARAMKLPRFVKIVVVPESAPKTKPKACNYGLNIARGEYAVIYDAEDMPDPKQLKKVYVAFNKAGSKVKCIQAKLNYYNSSQNLLTRLFTAEYSLWFDVSLTGMQSVNTIIPLGGTSNHFRTAELRELKGWDPFNVTEDCDLGVRLFRHGGRTALVESVTLEEANSSWRNWLKQRSRWIKGYMQTYLVHSRRPVEFIRAEGWHALLFQLSVGGKVLFLLINPLMWILTAAYFGLYALVGPAIEKIFPSVVFYMAAFSLVFGNFCFLYYYMIGLAKREEWSLVKYIYLVPVYWLWASIAAYIAAYQLLVKPYYWEKTVHGLHLGKVKGARVKVREERKREWRTRWSDLGIGERWGQVWASKGVWVSGGLLVGATMMANVLNFGYNAYLSRVASLETFGIIGLFGTVVMFSQAVMGAVGTTITHQVAYSKSKKQGDVVAYWRKIRGRLFKITLGITGVWVVAAMWLSRFFQTGSIVPILLFTPMWLTSALATVDGGFLGGVLAFGVLAVITVMEPLVKLVATLGWVYVGREDLVYSAIPIASAVNLVIVWLAARWYTRKTTATKNLKQVKFAVGFWGSRLVSGVAATAFLSVDVIMAKHYLSPEVAGQYALVSLVGKMIFFLGTLFSKFIIPLVSHFDGLGGNSRGVFRRLLVASTVATSAAYVGLGMLGRYTVPMLWGDKAEAIISYLPMYGLAMVVLGVAQSLVSYHQTKHRYLLSWVSLGIAGLEVVGMMWWHQSIGAIVQVVLGSSLVCLGSVVWIHLNYNLVQTGLWNLLDLLGLVVKTPVSQPVGEKPRILILNWRDTKHVWAGGAEVYVQELAKGLLEEGYGVTVFCGNDGQNPRNEVVDGVQVVRRGGFFTVYIWAAIYYVLKFRGKFKAIIDCENGVPFFSPVYAGVPVYLVIHHVHQEVFRENLRPPMSWLAQTMEKRLMPLVYGQAPVMTVSDSSKKAIMRHGLTRRVPVVVHNGVDLVRYIPGKKEKVPLLLYVGRLKAYKNLPTMLLAVKKLAEMKVEFKVVIAGFGEERAKLEKMVRELKISGRVRFVGKVSERRKIALYQKAWVAVNPSTMEGWGITSIEANACGTPVVASDVPGLRDSVRNPHSGYLVDHRDPNAFADRIFKIITNRRLRTDLSRGARDWAQGFSWKQSTLKCMEVIDDGK